MRYGDGYGIIAALCVLVAGVVSVPPHSSALELEGVSNEHVVKLDNGLNFLDLDGDGDQDLVVNSRSRGGATGRHSDTYSFFAQVDIDGATEWHKVSLNEFGAYGDDECMFHDIRLLLDDYKSDDRLTLVYADREPGEHLYDPAKVKFSVYKLTNIDDMGRSFPIYSFELRDAVMSEDIYCDVGKAFKKELGID